MPAPGGLQHGPIPPGIMGNPGAGEGVPAGGNIPQATDVPQGQTMAGAPPTVSTHGDDGGAGKTTTAAAPDAAPAGDTGDSLAPRADQTGAPQVKPQMNPQMTPQAKPKRSTLGDLFKRLYLHKRDMKGRMPGKEMLEGLKTGRLSAFEVAYEISDEIHEASSPKGAGHEGFYIDGKGGVVAFLPTPDVTMAMVKAPTMKVEDVDYKPTTNVLGLINDWVNQTNGVLVATQMKAMPSGKAVEKVAGAHLLERTVRAAAAMAAVENKLGTKKSETYLDFFRDNARRAWTGIQAAQRLGDRFDAPRMEELERRLRADRSPEMVALRVFVAKHFASEPWAEPLFGVPSVKKLIGQAVHYFQNIEHEVAPRAPADHAGH